MGTVSLVADVADRAKAYGVSHGPLTVLHVLEVHAAAEEALAGCRERHGPFLLECKTYRFTGHSRSDARGYLKPRRGAERLARDPINRLKHTLLDSGMSEEDLPHRQARRPRRDR